MKRKLRRNIRVEKKVKLKKVKEVKNIFKENQKEKLDIHIRTRKQQKYEQSSNLKEIRKKK